MLETGFGGRVVFGRSNVAVFRQFARVLAYAVLIASSSSAFAVVGTTSTSTVTTTAPVPAPAGQAGAQQNAGNTNNMASMLGKAAGVLSMASGGLYMAKGAQELSCCVQGCNTGAGTQSTAAKAAQDATNKANSDTLLKNSTAPHRQPVDYFHLRFPDGARNECPQSPRSHLRTPFPLLFELLQPATVQASGCLDGMLSLATGGLMMLNGMLGLAAANQNAQVGSSAMANADGMSSYPGTLGGATSPTPDSVSGTSASQIGGNSGTGASIHLDPALLRTGTANNIMGQFEQKFGIARDSFANDVLDGQDPRKILATAPKNPLSVSDMNKGMNAAKNMSDDDKAKALAGTALASAQDELSAQIGGGGSGGAGGRNLANAKDVPFGKHEEELDQVNATPAVDDPGLSPEVKAALLAKQLEDSKKNQVELSLFEAVHRKYREKSKSIFGYDPDAVLKGVGNADGL